MKSIFCPLCPTLAALSIAFCAMSCSNASTQSPHHASDEVPKRDLNIAQKQKQIVENHAKIDAKAEGSSDSKPSANLESESRALGDGALEAREAKSQKASRSIEVSIEGERLVERTFIASSIQYAPISGDKVLFAADDDKGNACIYLVEGGVFREVRVVANAQISCIDVGATRFRVATIERKSSGQSVIVVDSFGLDGTAISDGSWTVKTRGFVPDPGSRCAFFGDAPRKLYATGSRPRGDRGLERGLFVVESNKLSRVAGSDQHVPLIVGALPDDDGSIIVRRVARIGDKPHWPYFLYKIERTLGSDKAGYVANRQMAADFIVFDRKRQGAVSFNPSNCCYDNVAFGDGGTASEGGDARAQCDALNAEKCDHRALDYDIVDASPICGQEADGCFLYRRAAGDELHIAKGASDEVYTMPRGLRIVPIANGDSWLSLRLGTEQSDRGELYWGKTLPYLQSK